ncbi:Glyceraldehyde-3-phosphate dehydrogenase [Candidatus Arcanobacter lacustris]|jgi:glyceraldehyde 3-phosphate dehydrogenase|uniref:Glyceraldehyde-3-phosphate dehydrogenase n=1 Tax=Candidatus Arcanibacter lacustris TaxID=1607817 RepID=A0A0F5MQS8_9RICK|nr:Glyceraldehyde-3-phosphate dehydrogenase [Candidatus Arcanobacter lacustris]
MKIAINGLGRIGRAVIRAIFEQNRSDIKIVAATGSASLEDYAHLIKYDSVHGKFPYEVKLHEKGLIIQGQLIEIINQRDPAQINWASFDVDVVFECTGKFNNKEASSVHLASGAKFVLVSAPCDNADITVVMGVNDDKLLKSHQVISVGSCTTNALAPLAKIFNDHLAIENGFMTTIHSYTNDQNLLDGTHKDIRRARACAMSMIPTSTGAAKAIGLVLPELSGKLAGSAIRVPTPNVSMIDFCFNATKATSKEEINQIVEKASIGHYKNIVGYAKEKLVSIDFNHSSMSCVFDPFETNVIDHKLCRIVSWYDNEWGFSSRMLDVCSKLKDL